MSKWKHLTFEHRKLIASFLAKQMKLCEIADLLDYDPTTISKEIKRNRNLTKKGKINDKVCKSILRFPYVCNGCKKKYSSCPFTQYCYDAKNAQNNYKAKLVQSRTGLNLTPDEYSKLDNIIKNGVDNQQSIYHIVKDNPEINISVSSVYRLINEHKLTTKRMDLPYAVKYKKRKVNKQYEYKENACIDRRQRTYLDYLVHKREHPHHYCVQMDFLGAIKTDKKSILVMNIAELHFPILFLLESPNAQKVVDIFNQLEVHLSFQNFIEVFSYILTDRDPSFSNFLEIEKSFTTAAKRTSIFFCDSFNSSQKANVEQMNKQLRKFFPKKKTIDHLNQEDISKITDIIRNTRIASLSGATPKEAFIKVFGEEIYQRLSFI